MLPFWSTLGGAAMDQGMSEVGESLIAGDLPPERSLILM
jgi:hypothetical protein